MSRRAPTTRFAHDHNPYKVTTLTLPKPHLRCQRKPGHTTIDIGYSDATSDTYYDYYEGSFQHSPLRESRNTDVTSDDSGSTRLPYYEEERNRASRHEEEWEERLYHEIQTPIEPIAAGRRPPLSRLSDRPQSSMSSALTNAMVYGCGGKCQTFESICYFVLQLMFTMGILIGVSLGIAGLVLRKSAARNLQVLVYIGIMLAIVSALLLTIQCRAKNTARRRIKAIQSAKRAPIPMETFNVRNNPVQTLERLPSIRESQRLGHFPQVHIRPPVPRKPRNLPVVEEQQGIPWWRRRDLQK